MSEETEMSNDEILKRISAHQEAIKKLKTQLKPAKPLPEASLAQSNSDLLKQREAAFKKRKEEEDAVRAALLIVKDKKAKK